MGMGPPDAFIHPYEAVSKPSQALGVLFHIQLETCLSAEARISLSREQLYLEGRTACKCLEAGCAHCGDFTASGRGGGGNSANDEMPDSFSFLRCEARELNILKQGKGGTK